MEYYVNKQDQYLMPIQGQSYPISDYSAADHMQALIECSLNYVLGASSALVDHKAPSLNDSASFCLMTDKNEYLNIVLLGAALHESLSDPTICNHPAHVEYFNKIFRAKSFFLGARFIVRNNNITPHRAIFELTKIKPKFDFDGYKEIARKHLTEYEATL